MNSHEYIRNKKRRTTEQRKLPKIELDLSYLTNSNLKHSISSRKKRKSNNSKNMPTNLSIQNYHYGHHKKLIEKQISLNASRNKRYSIYAPYRKSLENSNNIDSKKRHSWQLVQTKTKKFFQKYNLKINGDNSIKKNSVGNYVNPLSKYEINHLEYKIQNVLNNMRIEIEKQSKKSERVNTLTPEIKINKLASSPNLKFFFKKKKRKKIKIKKKIYNHPY